MAYATKSDLEQRLGIKNVAQWADLDNDGDTAKINARITKALSYASDLIDDRFSGTQYLVPLEEAVQGEGVGSRVIDWTCRLAGSWLYNLRAVDRETTVFAGVAEGVEEEIAKTIAGMIRIPCKRNDKINAPGIFIV